MMLQELLRGSSPNVRPRLFISRHDKLLYQVTHLCNLPVLKGWKCLTDSRWYDSSIYTVVSLLKNVSALTIRASVSTTVLVFAFLSP